MGKLGFGYNDARRITLYGTESSICPFNNFCDKKAKLMIKKVHVSIRTQKIVTYICTLQLYVIG